MDLSIIIPVYNTPVYILRKCFASISLPPNISYEVIIVDDGSENEVGNYCKKYAMTHTCFRYVWQENQGVSRSRNAGIAIACGQYIMFVDSDDQIISSNIPFSCLKLEYDIIFCGFQIDGGTYDSDKNEFVAHKVGTDKKADLALMAFDDQLNSVWAKFFQRKFLVNHDIYFDEGMVLAEDAVFVLETIIKANSVYCCNNCIYKYFLNSDNVYTRIRKFREKIFENSYSIYLKRKEALAILIEKQVFSSEQIKMAQRYMDARLVMDWYSTITEFIVQGRSCKILCKKAQQVLKMLPRESIKEFPNKTLLKYYLLRWNMYMFMVLEVLIRRKKVFCK